MVPLTQRRSGSLRSSMTLAPGLSMSTSSVGCADWLNSPVVAAL
jgi:hypothetical protein